MEHGTTDLSGPLPILSTPVTPLRSTGLHPVKHHRRHSPCSLSTHPQLFHCKENQGKGNAAVCMCGGRGYARYQHRTSATIGKGGRDTSARVAVASSAYSVKESISLRRPLEGMSRYTRVRFASNLIPTVTAVSLLPWKVSLCNLGQKLLFLGLSGTGIIPS